MTKKKIQEVLKSCAANEWHLGVSLAADAILDLHETELRDLKEKFHTTLSVLRTMLKKEGLKKGVEIADHLLKQLQ